MPTNLFYFINLISLGASLASKRIVKSVESKTWNKYVDDNKRKCHFNDTEQLCLQEKY